MGPWSQAWTGRMPWSALTSQVSSPRARPPSGRAPRPRRPGTMATSRRSWAVTDGRNWRSAGGKQRVSSSHQANAEYAASRATPSVSTISSSSAAKSRGRLRLQLPQHFEIRAFDQRLGPRIRAGMDRHPDPPAGRRRRPHLERRAVGGELEAREPSPEARDPRRDPSQNSRAPSNPAAAHEPANRSRCKARPRTLPPATRNESATSKAFTRPCRS